MKESNKGNEINFSEKVYLRIGGEIGKNNSLPITYFAELAKNLQALINKLAESELPANEGIDMKNFSLELTDFRAGSAVPAFSFTRTTQSVIGANVEEQRETISRQFEKLMEIANTGDYQKLSDLYPDIKQKNAITKSLYGFVDSLKTPKISIGKYKSKSGFKADYKIRKFKKSLRNELLEEVKVPVEKETEYVYGRIELTTSNGKERKVIKEIYRPETAKLSHVFEEIRVTEKAYTLSAPLYTSLEKNENGNILIESEMLDLSSSGATAEEAIMNFSEAFHKTFQKLSTLKYGKLSEKMRVVKTFFTVLIKDS